MATEQSAEELQNHLDVLEEEAKRLRSDLNVVEAIVEVQRAELARSAENASHAAQELARFRVGDRSAAHSGDVPLQRVFSDAGSSAMPQMRDASCSVAPRNREVGTFALPLPLLTNAGVQTEAEELRYNSVESPYASANVAGRGVRSTVEVPSLLAASPDDAGLGASVVDADVERLRRRVAAQAKALLASRDREMERDAMIADLTRATLRQQMLLEAVVGPDAALLRETRASPREVRVPPQPSSDSPLVSATATPNLVAASASDVMSVPLASSLMAHFVSAMIGSAATTAVARDRAAPGPVEAAAVSPRAVFGHDIDLSPPNAVVAQRRAVAEAATPLLGAGRELQRVAVMPQAPALASVSPGADDPRLLVLSGVGVGSVALPPSHTGAEVVAAPLPPAASDVEASSALLEARAAAAMDKEARRAIRVMVSELREQISRIGPQRGDRPAAASSRPRAARPLASSPDLSSDARWEPTRDASPGEGAPRSGTSLLRNPAAPSSHEAVTSVTRQRSRRSKLRKEGAMTTESSTVALNVDLPRSAPPAEAHGISTRDASGVAGQPPLPSSLLTAATGTPKSDLASHQQLSFVDAFGQTITLLARCEFTPASRASENDIPLGDGDPASAASARDTDGAGASLPAPTSVLKPRLLRRWGEGSQQLSSELASVSAAARAASLEALIRQHKTAFDTLLLTRKLVSTAASPSAAVAAAVPVVTPTVRSRSWQAKEPTYPQMPMSPPPLTTARHAGLADGEGPTPPPGIRLRDLDSAGAHAATLGY